MYQAKAADGDSYRHFKPEMQDVVVKALALRADLKAAIAAQELTLAYQPIVDLLTGEISGCEALLRWEHPVRGTVSPATFIPVAEDSGLIIALGRWVLERACEDAVSFQQAGMPGQRRAVSVNISARQLHRMEIVEEVREALRSSGLDPGCLVLEITESLLIDDVELAIERLTALRALGVRVAVDDFGTGYSSLNYIRRLPIDFLKIDKQFIDSVDADNKDGKLTAAIIGLAGVLELQLRRGGRRTSRATRAAQGARLRLRPGLPARTANDRRRAARAPALDRAGARRGRLSAGRLARPRARAPGLVPASRRGRPALRAHRLPGGAVASSIGVALSRARAGAPRASVLDRVLGRRPRTPDGAADADVLRAPPFGDRARAPRSGAARARSRLCRGIARDRRHRRSLPRDRRLGPAADLAAREGAAARRARARGAPGGIPRRPATELLLPGARHSPQRDAEAIRYHYDVGNDFFALFLDESMTYSCALFSRGAQTLAEAQRAKLDMIAQKLELSEGQRVLDVGCGWGSFAIHAAREYGVSVTGITLSPSQAELARRMVADAGVADRVEIRIADYRDLAGESYDAIASIGMAEHVGQSQIDRYAQSLFGVLKPGGLVLNHAISLLRPEEDPLADEFTNRYVFPDGEPLLLSRVQLAFERARFRTEHIEGFMTDYAVTLRHWHDRLDEHLAEAERLAGAQRLRVWRLYLRAARHGFDVGYTSVYQLKARKPA